MALKAPPLKAAEVAVQSIGLGFDISNDVRLKFCKRGSHLIDLSEDDCHNVVLPGGLVIHDVPGSIKVDKGERIRFASDVLSFEQMATQFNQEMSIFGKIPSGLFNHMFELFGCWQNDAAKTKSLAFDGWFITLYTVALSKPQVVLCDHVKEAVPSTWDPSALARFIQKYGTHVITAIKMGGKDVIYMKQQHSSTLQSAEFQKILKEIAEKRFFVASSHHEESYGKDKFREQRLRFAESSSSSFYSNKEDIKGMFKRRGGREDNSLSHSEWLKTVQYQPDVISMSFIPITSLLNGVPGSGFLNHAINIYLRYKPPIEELHQFLEFQLPRQWAPSLGDLPLGPCQKQHGSAYLRFTFMGPKLHVNTSLVDVGKKPVTGLRLHLEGKKGNRLAIHLQHLITLPQILKLQDVNNGFHQEAYDRKYYEPVQWRYFSHVCTAPVEADDDLSIVTSAQLHVGSHGFKKALLLRLGYATVQNAVRVRTDWDGSPGLTQKSGFISTLISTHFSMAIQKPLPRPADMNINSAVYPGGPPVPVQTPRLLKLVDTTEMTRGPQDSPGYWVVTGAKLHLERGKISLRVKYSLLTVLSADDEDD